MLALSAHHRYAELICAGSSQWVPLAGDESGIDRLAGAGGLAFLQRLNFVEPLDEEQVGELFDNGQRVGNAAGPHRIPDAIDSGFEFAGDHCLFTVKGFSVSLSAMDILFSHRPLISGRNCNCIVPAYPPRHDRARARRAGIMCETGTFGESFEKHR
jgi:hypothetical protein